jgi:hypothetical protein
MSSHASPIAGIVSLGARVSINIRRVAHANIFATLMEKEGNQQRNEEEYVCESSEWLVTSSNVPRRS